MPRFWALRRSFWCSPQPHSLRSRGWHKRIPPYMIGNRRAECPGFGHSVVHSGGVRNPTRYAPGAGTSGFHPTCSAVHSGGVRNPTRYAPGAGTSGFHPTYSLRSRGWHNRIPPYMLIGNGGVHNKCGFHPTFH